jgi:hypothetical protein
MLELASELPSAEPAPPVNPPQQLLMAMPQPINPVHNSDDDLSPPPDILEPDQTHKIIQSDLKWTALASSSRIASGCSTISKSMLIE